MDKINYDSKFKERIQKGIIKLYRELESNLFYKKTFFLDSNFLIPKNDRRHKILRNKGRKFLVTEYIFNEINKKNNDWQKIISPNRLNIINFEDLRINFPATCPLYYNFIKSMHNPANICNPDFFINKNFAVKEKHKLTNERIDFNQVLISRFYKGHKNEFNKLGKKKGDWENYLNASFLSRLNKRKSLKNKGTLFFNDYKNLSLILVYTLLNRRNSYFFTSDIDIFCNLFTWIDSMAHQTALKIILLNQMKEEGKTELLKGKKLVFYINYDEFKKQCDETLEYLLIDNKKKKRFNLVIKYWDKNKQKFYNGMKIAFDENIRDLLINNQGLLWCPFAANNTHGNFFRYLYLWPPNSIHDINTIKVSVQAKSRVHADNITTSKMIHNLYCKFKIEEDSGDSIFYQSFRIAG